MPSPKISIIIPVYNNAAKLAECLESAKKQTFQDYEVIIVNDGSTDITAQEMDSISQLYNLPIIQLLHQSNQGAPTARNKGFDESRGEFVIFCDADIVMEPDMLEKMRIALDENPGISYAYSSFKFGWKKFKLWEFDAKKLREMPYIHTTSMIRREHFQGFDESLARFQDWDLWLTMLERGFTGKWIDEILFQVKSGGTMSAWMPSFLVNFGIGRKARQYRQARANIMQKHPKTTDNEF